MSRRRPRNQGHRGTPAHLRPTDAEVERRVGEVVRLIGQGNDRRAILQHAATSWGCATRTGDEYIARARAELRAMLASDRDDARAELMAWHRETFRLAMEKKDPKAATAAGRELGRLLALYPDPASPTHGSDPAATLAALLAAAARQ